MDSVHHIWCPLSSQEYQDLPDGAETTLTDISAVAKGLNHLLLEPGEPDLQKLLNWLGVKDKRPLPDGRLVQHSLQGYDNLMRKGGLQ
ncbi:TPA: hypothetical protein MBF27_005512 [Klebsiella pneumoniae]|nr:hypothetical protein [Klebsiella pneumoniae]